MDYALTVENLGKKYVLRHQNQPRYIALRDVISYKTRQFAHSIMHPFSGSNKATNGTREDFWALRDVNLTIKQGERVGIIGRNGAGKSTFLKLLSRITEPTTGRIKLKGRVSSLLEVGTGFHPELTGRENIYLNGAILGMRRTEIKNKFDEIVAFAEVEKFLDTPVKRYSSGMYVRLAFAVAAHLETEIMLVDEVLAVGDAEFQKKCLGKMNSVSSEGKTVLFVSHNMSAVAQLCQRGLLFENGNIKEDSSMRQAIDTYLSHGTQQLAKTIFRDDPSKPIQISQLTILDHTKNSSSDLDFQQPFHIAIDIKARETIRGTTIAALYTGEGTKICQSVHADQIKEYSRFSAGQTTRITLQFPGNILNEGTYQVKIWLVPGNIGFFDVTSTSLFHIHELNRNETFFGLRKRETALIQIPVQWSTD